MVNPHNLFEKECGSVSTNVVIGQNFFNIPKLHLQKLGIFFLLLLENFKLNSWWMFDYIFMRKFQTERLNFILEEEWWETTVTERCKMQIPCRSRILSSLIWVWWSDFRLELTFNSQLPQKQLKWPKLSGWFANIKSKSLGWNSQNF